MFSLHFSVSGGELFERVIDEEFDLTEKECTFFLRQICEGVKFMHSQDILHLDMKVSVKIFMAFQIKAQITTQNFKFL